MDTATEGEQEQDVGSNFEADLKRVGGVVGGAISEAPKNDDLEELIEDAQEFQERVLKLAEEEERSPQEIAVTAWFTILFLAE